MSSRSFVRWGWICLGGASIVAWALTLPAITRQGVNFTVSTYRIPLYLKGLSFFDRHCQYRLLSQQITQGQVSDQARALTVFAWTRRHILPTPPGLPIVDDHVLNIIIRGYGEADQMADVFTTLLTYAGVPAFWRVVKNRLGTERVVLSFAFVVDRWRVFDIANGVVFTDAQGQLADVEELLAQPGLAQRSADRALPHPIEYQQFIGRLRPFSPPKLLRAHQQMLWHRFVFEIQRWLPLRRSLRPAYEGRWEEKPPPRFP